MLEAKLGDNTLTLYLTVAIIMVDSYTESDVSLM